MQINGGFVLLSKATAAVREPVNYQREFNNDISKPAVAHPWLEKGQRVALVALPFISQYKPLGFLITSTMGTARFWTSSSQLIESIRQGNAKEASYHTLQTTIAALSLASTFFAHPIGMILTTGQDLIIEAANLNRYLRDGEYQKAAESCLKIINNSFYLCSFIHGGIELTIASLAMQIVLGIYQAQAEFRDGRYLEGSGQLLMVVMRGTQLAGQVKILQMKLGMEKLIQEAETKKNSSFETSVNSGEERVTLSLKNSDPITVLKSDKALTEKAITESNENLIKTLIKCGNNPMGIPALHYAAATGDEASVKLLLEYGASPNSKLSYKNDVNNIEYLNTPNTVLEFAARYGHLNTVILLLDKGAEIQRNETGCNGENCIISPLIFAADGNHAHIIKALVSRGAQCNLDNPFSGWNDINPLYRGVNANATDAVQALLELGARVDDPKLTSNCDLLSLAVEKGDIKLVQLLINFKIVIDHPSIGSSALGKAVQTQKIDVIKLLLSKGAKIHAEQTAYYHNNPWFLSIVMDNPEIIEILVKAGANIHAVDESGMEAIFFAAQQRKLEALKALVKAGCDANIKDRNGNSLIANALDNSQILQYLIDTGADTDVIHGQGQTLLHLAAQRENSEVIHVLMKAGGKINAKDNNGRTPLHNASDGKVFLALLERGADINEVCKQGWTPVQSALNAGTMNLDALKFCIKLGANVNQNDPHGMNFLANAIDRRKLEIATFLIDNAGADINAKNSKTGWTPFIRAVAVGYLEGMQFLFKKGAEINAKGNNNETALSMARTSYPQFVNWLIEHGAK